MSASCLPFLPTPPWGPLSLLFFPLGGGVVYWKYFATRVSCKMCVLCAYEGDMAPVSSRVNLYIIYYQK